ncbi:MAG: glycosyltransferase [Planctomycetales bacterium]
MHVLFVHKNYPAQFGHVAQYLAGQHGLRCTFISEKPAGRDGAIERLQYQPIGGATQANSFLSRSFENAISHTHGVYAALQARPDIQPDLVVGHSGFGSTLFLRELYDCPIINYFEYFYRRAGTDLDFRPDFPPSEMTRLRVLARNAMLLLDLENCQAGYSPTQWQHHQLPVEFHDKVRVIFDGIDTNLWRPQPAPSRRLGNWQIPDGVRVVTYVSRGLESMRGFDLFMQLAGRLCECRSDLIFVIVGEDRICYGGDADHIGGNSFKQWVLSRGDYDLSRFFFLGLIPPASLAHLFNLSDLHVYLTVPFVLSWSLLNALACGTTVLASDTPPVREVIEHGRNGLLTDFFDLDAMTETALTVLDRPQEFRRLGRAGSEMVAQRYSLEVCLPRMLALYQSV